MLKFVIDKQQRFIEWRKNYRLELELELELGGSASVWNGSEGEGGRLFKKGNLAPKEAERFKLGLKYRRDPRYVDWAHRPMQEGTFFDPITSIPCCAFTEFFVFSQKLVKFLKLH